VNDDICRSNRSVGFYRRFVESFNASRIAARSKSLSPAVFGRFCTPLVFSGVLLCVLGSSVQGFAEPSSTFAVESYKKDATGVTVTTSQGLMRVEICTDRIIHVTVTPEKSFSKQLLITIPKIWSPVPYSLQADGERLLLSTAALTVEIARNTGAVTFLSRDGKHLLQEASRSFTPAMETGTADKRVIILTRSAFIAQQRNAAASWSGDISVNWEIFRRQIPDGLNFLA
jgi:hypothetical protein